MKILGIGQSVIDNISLISADGTVASGELDAGGPVLVAMIMLAKLGGDCTFVTTLGRDAGAAYITDLLTRESVELLASRQALTKMNTIRVDERTGQRQKTQSSITHPPIAGLEPAFLRGFDMIVMDRHERAAFYEVARRKRPNAKLVIDPSTELSEFTLDMMRQADCPIVTIGTLARVGHYSLTDACRELSEMIGKPIIATLGEHGTLTYDGHAVQIIPAYEVDVVNDLGAGDVYRGAFAHGQMQGWPMVQCTRYASAAAAAHCTKPGNAGHVPDAGQIDALMLKAESRPTSPIALDISFQTLRRALQPETSIK
jgi:sulfofructose kinase